MGSYWEQADWEIRFEWGRQGLEQLRPHCGAIAIVDVLSFSTAVDIAVGRGAVVFPYPHRDASAERYAHERGALLAVGGREATSGYSLSPASLRTIPPGSRLVLPSPNGATLSTLAGETPTFAACLRNAQAVGTALARQPAPYGIIAAGERWPDGTLRPALEDMLGAGALIHALSGSRSPEAAAAEALFLHVRDTLPATLKGCASGVELLARGFETDLALAGALNSSDVAPRLHEGAYRATNA